MGWFDLLRELKVNGGISGCAAMYADLQRRGKLHPQGLMHKSLEAILPAGSGCPTPSLVANSVT
jgi:hypothetical protein